jgi:hypothetical protein
MTEGPIRQRRDATALLIHEIHEIHEKRMGLKSMKDIHHREHRGHREREITGLKFSVPSVVIIVFRILY